MKHWQFLPVLAGLLSGCVASPHVPLSAADSMELVASTLETTVAEFGSDLDELDRQRRQAVIEAFITRVQQDHDDERALALHSGAFTGALDRIESDRRTTSDRKAAAVDNIELLREVAEGLRRSALQSMKLQDDALQYFTGVLSRTSTQPQHSSGETNERQP